MTLHPQYLTDQKGRKTAVLIPYSEYEKLVKSAEAKSGQKNKEVKVIAEDWFEKLSLAQQKSILQGLSDIENNDVVSHTKVVSKVKQLLKKARV